jgi:hypothetical protein
MGCGCKSNSCGSSCGSGCGSGSGSKHGKHCKTYTIATKNPFDVGVASISDNNEYIVVLTGDNHSTSDFDGDNLPDWVGVGERPGRTYQTLTTKELVELFKRHRGRCDDPCLNLTTYKTVCPNAFITFSLVNGLPQSAAVEILDARIDHDDRGPMLCFRVKILHPDDDRLVLDGLHTRMFRVNLVIDAVKPFQPKKH